MPKVHIPHHPRTASLVFVVRTGTSTMSAKLIASSPCLTRSRPMSKLPLALAHDNGVRPKISRAFTPTGAFNKQSPCGYGLPQLPKGLDCGDLLSQDPLYDASEALQLSKRFLPLMLGITVFSQMRPLSLDPQMFLQHLSRYHLHNSSLIRIVRVCCRVDHHDVHKLAW